MIGFTFQYGNMPLIDSLKEGFEEWKSHIEIDRDKYQVKVISRDNNDFMYGQLVVEYKDMPLFYVDFYKKYRRNPQGGKSICSMIYIRTMDEGEDLLEPGNGIRLQINDRLEVNYNGKQNVNIAKALMDVWPIRDEKQIEKITEILDVQAKDILFDTFEKRYVILTPIKEFEWKQSETPDDFYKYVSLSTFQKMLTNKTFRMNSIVSQSDTTETFYLGDFLCSDYEDEFKRFRGILSESNVLISSFTRYEDEKHMWYEYGDKGKGVCLGFQLTDDQTLHEIQYVDETTTPLNKYREQVKILKDNGIRVHFSVVDDWHRFVKNDKYGDEKEWRLILNYDGELDDDLYGDRCVKYKDFSFEGCRLPKLKVILTSITVGPCQPTSNFPILADRARKVWGKQLSVNRSQIPQSEMNIYVKEKDSEKDK